MKVCQISSVHNSNDIRVFKKQCVSLVKSGNQVTFLVQESHDHLKDGVQIKALRKRKSGLARLFLTLPTILFYTVKNKFDIYHAHDPELIPVLFVLRMLGRTVVYDMHENFPKQLATKNINPMIKKVLGVVWPALERIVLPRINVVYAETSYKEDYRFVKSYIDILNMPILDEMNGIDKTKYKEFSIGYVGGVSNERYLDKTLEAIERLEKKGIDVRFECVGPAYYKETQQCIAKYQKKLKNFNFHGELPPSEAWSLIAKTHVGIAMLMPLPNYVDSYPTKLFEYLAMGMPVITSNFELYKPIVEDNNLGFCIDPLDSTGFEHALEKFATMPSLLATMSENSSMVLEQKYSWIIEFKKLTNFYREIIG